ncbi:MAG: XrtA/PEP-CTERM system exopolysaccharide export protein [Rudaea sp.]
MRFLTLVALAMLVATQLFAAESGVPKAISVLPVDVYHIGVDDLVQVSVWHNPDLSVSVPVRPDGRISVPLVGDVIAGGRTPEEVAATIKEKLAVYVREPQVAVILTELRSHEYLSRVRVTGAVRQPVSVPYRQGMTVLDAVLAAGGTTEFAAPDRTVLYRKEGEQTKSFDVRLDRILKKGELSTNYAAQPGDIITVPERAF